MKRFLASLVFLTLAVCATNADGQQLPRVAQDHLDRARADMLRRQYDEAIGELRSALKVSSACVDCYFQLLHAYQLLGAHKDALDTARKALEVAPDDRLRSAAHDGIGAEISELAKAGKMRHEDAEREFRTAIQLDPNNMTANFNLGVELMRENRDSEGIAVLANYLQIAPQDSNAKDARLMIDNPRRAREDFAPGDFSVVTKDGEYLTLDDVKGKVVLLDFWASFSPPSVAALPTLRGLSKRYSKDQFMLISISMDQNQLAWQKFMAAHQMDWPQVLDRQARLSRMFNVGPIPTYVLIDSEGVMRSYVIGSIFASAAQLNDEVKKYVKDAQKPAQAASVKGPSPASITAAPLSSGGTGAVPAATPVSAAGTTSASNAGSASFVITSDPSGGEIYVDGNLIGSAPQTLQLPPGNHMLGVKMAGRNPWLTQITAVAGSEAHITATLAETPLVVTNRWQNVPPEEMWKRVTQCVLPAYPASALNSHLSGTVNIGLGISPQGDVADNSRVVGGPDSLTQPAMDAIRQWQFRPNVVQGQLTWSRVRALVRFDPDGTVAVSLAPGVLADDFGDSGTPPAAAAARPIPKPATAPECQTRGAAGAR